jgi:hypothetical protein
MKDNQDSNSELENLQHLKSSLNDHKNEDLIDLVENDALDGNKILDDSAIDNYEIFQEIFNKYINNFSRQDILDSNDNSKITLKIGDISRDKLIEFLKGERNE